jgi:undecaprenyl diphosphate synthase
MKDTIAHNLRKKGLNPEKALMPKHVAITAGGLNRLAIKSNRGVREAYEKAFKKIEELIKYQLWFDIPIITVYLMDSKIKENPDFSEIMDALSSFFRQLPENGDLFEEKVKISVLGKWYDLPSRVVEPIKKVIDETKDYDSFFMNLCINYDGKEEILDACRIIVRKALKEKTDVDSITEETIKDNIYSSYFLPPELMMKTGTGKRFHGFLLWDSTQAIIYFSDIPFVELNENQFIKALKYYQENKYR